VADADSYAPVTILIQELPDGGTRVAYDSVASHIARYTGESPARHRPSSRPPQPGVRAPGATARRGAG